MTINELLKTANLTQQELASALGIRQPSVSKWRERIPVNRVPALERITGIPRAKIRPDIFGAE